MRKLIIALVLMLSSCYSFQGLSTSGTVIKIGKETSLIQFPCLDQKRFKKPCYRADYFSNSEFDTLYLGMKVRIR
jgi:hypothetical protein